MAAVKKADKVKIKLPRAQKGEANFITVSLNGKVYQIQKGVTVEVPRGVAEIIVNSEDAKEAAINYIETMKE